MHNILIMHSVYIYIHDMYLLTLLNKFLETYEQHPIPQVLRVGNRRLIILHLRLNESMLVDHLPTPPKKKTDHLPP